MFFIMGCCLLVEGVVGEFEDCVLEVGVGIEEWLVLVLGMGD